MIPSVFLIASQVTTPLQSQPPGAGIVIQRWIVRHIFVEDIGSEPITHTCQVCVLPLKLIPLYLYTSDTIEATFMYHFFYIFCNAYKIRVDDRDRTGSNSCLEGRRTTNYASSTYVERVGIEPKNTSLQVKIATIASAPVLCLRGHLSR